MKIVAAGRFVEKRTRQDARIRRAFLCQLLQHRITCHLHKHAIRRNRLRHLIGSAFIELGGFTMLDMESSDQPSDSQQRSAGQFATTHWSLVLAAGERGNAESKRALEKLCRAYWPPLYAYVGRRVSDIHEAQDLTQAFFERLLEKHYLADADPERGRFRAFLITAFRHFLSKEWDKSRAQKRGGGRRLFSLDFALLNSNWNDHADHLTPERIYERKWAITLLDRVMDRLRQEMERSSKSQQFDALKDFIGGSGRSSYAIPAAELQWSEAAARVAASRLRGRYCQLLRQEITQTVSTEEDIISEMQHLFRIFSE